MKLGLRRHKKVRLVYRGTRYQPPCSPCVSPVQGTRLLPLQLLCVAPTDTEVEKLDVGCSLLLRSSCFSGPSARPWCIHCIYYMHASLCWLFTIGGMRIHTAHHGESVHSATHSACPPIDIIIIVCLTVRMPDRGVRATFPWSPRAIMLLVDLVKHPKQYAAAVTRPSARHSTTDEPPCDSLPYLRGIPALQSWRRPSRRRGRISGRF